MVIGAAGELPKPPSTRIVFLEGKYFEHIAKVPYTKRRLLSGMLLHSMQLHALISVSADFLSYH